MEIKVEINGCNITAKIYFHLIFVTFQCMHDLHKSLFLFLLFCVCFTIIAKQRIDSGFFLFQADEKKKKEKKNRMMAMKKARENMMSSDDDFV